MRINKFKRCKYLDGALYTTIFEDTSDIITIKNGDRLTMDVITDEGRETKIKIFNDENINCPHLSHCCNVGKVLSTYKGNTFCKNRQDKGDMYILGNGVVNGKKSVYKLTTSESIKEAIEGVCETAYQYYSAIGFKEEADDILKKKIQINDSILSDCFVNSIVSSCNLINSAHVDANDATESLVTWTDDNTCPTEGWYFILPNVSRDGKKGIVIKIQNGLTIKWDATIILHCSTNKVENKDYNVYGTYFGSRRDYIH